MPAELLQTGATELRTPLGAFRIAGPRGPVPFAVSRRPVPDSHKGVLKQHYSLSISLDELIAGEAYVVEFDGPDLAYADSDEFGQLNKVIANGITVGISGFSPNEQKITWPEGPSPDLKGYYISGMTRAKAGSPSRNAETRAPTITRASTSAGCPPTKPKATNSRSCCSTNPKKPRRRHKCCKGKHALAHRWPPIPQKNPSAAPRSAAEGSLTASNFYPDSGRPHSPSSYTTLPAQMVYFTFP